MPLRMVFTSGLGERGSPAVIHVEKFSPHDVCILCSRFGLDVRNRGRCDQRPRFRCVHGRRARVCAECRSCGARCDGFTPTSVDPYTASSADQWTACELDHLVWGNALRSRQRHYRLGNCAISRVSDHHGGHIEHYCPADAVVTGPSTSQSYGVEGQSELASWGSLTFENNLLGVGFPPQPLQIRAEHTDRDLGSPRVQPQCRLVPRAYL